MFTRTDKLLFVAIVTLAVAFLTCAIIGLSQ